MIEAKSHLIRLRAGGVRVLRLAAIGGHLYPLRYEVTPDQDMCTVCGCTAIFGCPEGCSWVDLAHTVCSRCFKKWMLPHA